MPMNKNWFPPGLVFLLIVSGVLLVSWALAVPIFEGPDEPLHWQYALFIHQHGEMPVYNSTNAEANQPPLYYLLAAPFTTPSPHPRSLISIGPDGKTHMPSGANIYEHSSLDGAKYGALFTLRVVTLFFSLLTILFCYWIGLEASGKVATGLLTAGLVAFLPQFTFRGTNISNDALLTLLCAIATFWIVRLVKRGFSWRLGAMAGISMGLAFLSRINAIILPAPFGLALVCSRLPWRKRLESLGALGIPLLIAAPWLISNQIQYGDPLANNLLVSVVARGAVDPKPITSPYFVDTFPVLLFESFIGRFGWGMNVILPDWIYLASGLFMLASLWGLGRRVVRNPSERRLALVLLAVPLLSLASIVYLNLTFSIPFGRYLFPALPAMAVLMALGVEGLPGWSDNVTWAILSELGLMNVFVLQAVLVPAHALGA